MGRLVFAALIVIVACSAMVESPITLQGDYRLTSVNNVSLPVAIASVPPEILQLTGGRITLEADSTFIDSTFSRLMITTPGAPVVEYRDGVAGRWERVGDTVHMRSKQGEYLLAVQRAGDLTRFFPRSQLRGPYLDVTYRYERSKD